MLGEKVGDIKGKIVLKRVLPATAGEGPKVETTFEGTGSLLGVEMKDIGTYLSVLRPDGSLLGDGQGILMGKGGEMATWKGQGIGLFGEGGAVSYRGAIFHSTQSRDWEQLNKMAIVFHWDVDADGNARGELFEWR